jgi:hypothetical protein
MFETVSPLSPVESIKKLAGILEFISFLNIGAFGKSRLIFSARAFDITGFLKNEPQLGITFGSGSQSLQWLEQRIEEDR